jgi:hypothetical protein
MASPTYQQRVSRSDDHAAMLDKAHHATMRVADLENNLAAGEAQIRAAQSRLDSIPAYDRGWMLEVIGILALVSITLEWYPARMMSLVFFFASATELIALTAAFAVGGFLLGLLLGELLRRHRKPQPHAALDWVFLSCAIVAVVAFLAVGFMLRMAYAQASNDGTAAPIGPIVQASALTTLAFIGIVIAFTSGYYRESVEAARVRRRLMGMRGDLRANEQHLEATKQELAAAERAFRFADDEPGRAAEARARYGAGAGAAAAQTATYDSGASSPSANGVAR